MPATDLKPIQTRYGGCHFRSRLEARWAVYFDARGWSWEYEPEGFQLPSGWYLPDFRVLLTPNCSVCCGGPRQEWIEIKGTAPTDTEISLAIELAVASEMQVSILGNVPRPGTTEPGWRARGFGHQFRFEWISSRPRGHSFAVLGGENVAPRPDGMPELDWLISGGMGKARARNMFLASTAALSARFEHGESGRT